VIAAYAVTFGVVTVGSAFWLPAAGSDHALISVSGVVSILFGLVMFAKPGAGAMVVLGLITAAALVAGITEVAVAIGGERLIERRARDVVARAVPRTDIVRPACSDGLQAGPRSGGVMGDAADVTASRIEDLPQLWDGFAKLVRAGLGIRAFGVQIMDLPPNYRTASHDETASGQEELYVALGGAGGVVLDATDEVLPLDLDNLVRVGPSVARTLTSGPDGLRVLCIGGVPGGAYVPPEWTEPGGADPHAE
jgi:hypothetical protein